jgi:putative nucleotidyltransferase-like protein
VCECLHDAPASRASVPAEVLTWAREEGVLLLLADRLRIGEFAGELRDAAVIEALGARELGRVLEALADRGVHPVLIKGAALAYTHYERPELRPRIDVDLMIPADAREAVAHILAAAGYVRPSEIDGDIAIGQFHFVREDEHGCRHVLDVHWRASNVRAFADVVTYDELARDAVAVPGLGPHAKAASSVHGLLIACAHRIAHHNDAPDLLWLYDVHLISKALTANEWEAFTRLAAEKRMRAVCVRTLTLAQEAFGGGDSPLIAALAPADSVHEPSAVFVGGGLRQVDILRSDLAATPWRSRLQLLREHLFPSPSYMRQRFPRCPAMLLPLAYACRIVVGAPRWVRR